jgi:hypothetical protein
MADLPLRRIAAALIPPVYVMMATGLWLALVAALLVPAMEAALRGAGAATVALALSAIGFAAGAAAPARWFALRSAERSGRVYTRLGVRRFRAIAHRGDIMNRVRRRIAGTRPPTMVERAAYPSLARWTLWNERIHWVWVLATPPLIIWGATHGRLLAAALVLAAMVPLNLYPIMLQRYTRGRLGAAMRRSLVTPTNDRRRAGSSPESDGHARPGTRRPER